MSIRSIVIIGSGNVATHLGTAFKQNGFAVDVVYSRKQAHASELAHKLGAIPYTRLDLLPTHADLYLIAVKDTAIEDIANELPKVNGLVVHTSGTTHISVLDKHNRAGVFYPLQSLSRNAAVAMKDIPVLLETALPADLKLLDNLASTCGSKTLQVTSSDRQVVHMAAVFANNFSNHMYVVADQILSTKGISIDILKPLILETANKVQAHSPLEMQTGPAARNDTDTMDMHLKLLEQMPRYKEIYALLSKGISSESRAEH
jgi:predicted short-subunit dehydrogenase-like oxidoreductase (DUF2520 family)